MGKQYATASDALAGLTFDGMTIMSGGFGLCGIAENDASNQENDKLICRGE